MEHTISINEENTYWSLLKGLSKEMKLKLIKRLSESLLATTAVTPEDITSESKHKEISYPLISKDRKVSNKVMNMAIGPLPEGLDWDKETDKMWEELAR